LVSSRCAHRTVLLFVSAPTQRWWASSSKKQAGFYGRSASCPTRVRGTAHPDIDNIRREKSRRHEKLAPLTARSALFIDGGVEMVPPIAAEFGIKVTWAPGSTRMPAQQREIEAAIRLPRNSNVIGVVVGNRRLPRRERRRPDRTDQAGQEVGQRAGHDANLEHWRDNRNSLPVSTSSPPTSCLLGEFSDKQVDQASTAIALREKFPQASRDRGIRLAERGL